MLALIVATLMQAPGSEVWKERHQPEPPVLPQCDLGPDTKAVFSMKALPPEVEAELFRFFASAAPMTSALPMSDVGGPFNRTDFVDGPVPQRRFIRAYRTGRYWVIWYERGGFLSGLRMIAMSKRIGKGNDPASWMITPGTIFNGDLCIATKAAISGVRSSNP